MGKFEGRRGSGRPRTKLVDILARTVGGCTTSAQLLQLIERRSDRRFTVANALRDTAPRYGNKHSRCNGLADKPSASYAVGPRFRCGQGLVRLIT